MKLILRKIHRWLGLLMAVQLIAWMGSGLYFSWFPIAEIRGEHLTRAAQSPGRQDLVLAASGQQVESALDASFGEDWVLASVDLVMFEGAAHWRVSGVVNGSPFKRLVDTDGRMREKLTAEEAQIIAERWLLEETEAVRALWVEPADASSEFRGREQPAWRIDFTGEEPLHLYLDPWTGDVLARRTTRWRIFDFLWMLHIMDYQTRDNFNHPLLQIAASLGLLIALSGVLYWYISNRALRLSRRSGPARP